MDPAVEIETKARAYQKAMNDVIDRGDSPVQQFYCGAAVFVTGGSGFLGKQLIEKLFRSCKLKKVYLLMRPKKGKAIQERLQLILEDPVFDMVREKQPHFADRIVPVEGDVADVRLGLSDKNWTTITKEVNIIIHMAATVRFDEPLKVATVINVRGTKETIALARNCQNLKQFIHVSTAYAHATKERVGKEVLEQFYPCPVPPDVMMQLVETLDEKRLQDITPELIKGWPNTYTFTKAIAEELIRTTAGDLPMCVVKPPVVTPCHYEPSPGWLDLNGLTGTSAIVLGVGLGVLHVFFVDKKKKSAVVPLDYVNNAIIGAGWDSSERRKDGDKEIPVYLISNEESLVSWELFGLQMRTTCRRICSLMAVWYCFLVESNNKITYWILTWFLHYIPAYVLDAICSITGKRPMNISSFVKIYEKIDKKSALYSYFATNEWLFREKNVKSMINRMSDADKAIFNCDITKIDFAEYTLVWCIGVRKYILKDGLEGSVAAGKRQKIFYIAHIVFLGLYFYVLWIIATMFVNVIKFVVLCVI